MSIHELEAAGWREGKDRLWRHDGFGGAFHKSKAERITKVAMTLAPDERLAKAFQRVATEWQRIAGEQALAIAQVEAWLDPTDIDSTRLRAHAEKALQVARAAEESYKHKSTEPLPKAYPHKDGDVTVLGPECFISEDDRVISYKGQNYVPQSEPARCNDRGVVAEEGETMKPSFATGGRPRPRQWTLKPSVSMLSPALVSSGPVLAHGERVEVVELSAPSERDVEAACEAFWLSREPQAPWSEVPEGVKESIREPIRAVLSAVPSRPGGDAERGFDAAIDALGTAKIEGPCGEPAAMWLRANRDRILREAGQEPSDAERVAREVADELRAVANAMREVGFPKLAEKQDAIADRLSPRASVAGPGKEGAR